MDWREKLIWGGLGLVLISWGLEIFNVWSILVARLSQSNWITVALIYPAALVALIEAWKSAPPGRKQRGRILLATVIVLITWSYTFSLIGKVGR